MTDITPDPQMLGLRNDIRLAPAALDPPRGGSVNGIADLSTASVQDSPQPRNPNKNNNGLQKSTKHCDCSNLRGRILDLCTGEGHDGRPAPRQEAVDHWRRKNCPDVVPLLPRTKKSGVRIKSYPAGPGTELKNLLAALGFSLKESCGCTDRMEQMNAWGVAGCRKNRGLIISWLKEAAEETTVLERFRGAVQGLLQGVNPLDPYGSLVDISIARAEQKHEMDVRGHDGSGAIENNIPDHAQ